nr:MAG TPA: hypothetical protein [Caudoviricetes sp.]
MFFSSSSSLFPPPKGCFSQDLRKALPYRGFF